VNAMRQAAYATPSIMLAPQICLPVCAARFRSEEADQGWLREWDR
jgi:hypothetical protein